MSAAVPAALAGAADTAVFLARRPRLLRENPGRAAGSLALLGLWLAAAATIRGGRTGAGATSLAATLTAANAALLAAHLRAGIVNPRVFAGAALSGIVLADALRRR
ncbi:MAG TPA: hypothetical protein VEK76_09025 [Candidatus Binatia bacterium]|nr:hypothetical protein [Candidatus Binatia bacterium]